MGVTLRRIAFGLLVALAVLLALRKPARVQPGSSFQNRDVRAHDLSVRIAQAKLNWSAWEERDSVLASIRRPAIALHGFRPNASLDTVEAAFVASLVGTALRDSSFSVRLHLYQGNAYGRSWWSLYSGALITPDGAQCIAILPAMQSGSNRIVAGRHSLGSVLAPCMLGATFGTPGKTAGNWLRNLRYASASSGEWLTRITNQGWDSDPWGWLVDASFLDPQPNRVTLSRLLGMEHLAQLLAPPYHYGQLGVQCLAGIKTSCARAVLDPGFVSQETQRLPPDLTIRPSQIRSSNVTLFSIRPPGTAFVSDLIQDKGTERFSKFWKSDAPFERAFQDAFQESLADWTYRWARKRWLMTWESRYRSADILVGITLLPRWIPAVLGWSALAVGIAGWAARRRQVTAM